MSQSWQESTITLANEQVCAIRSLGNPQGRPILALHGWQDNAATFAKLGPYFDDYHFVALEFPGHGKSAPRPPSAQYYIWSYITDVRGVVEHFGWQEFDLLGHSMGGAVGCLYAGLYPEGLRKMILLDAIGPVATEAAKLPKQMREAQDALGSLKTRQRNYYRNYAAAVQARVEKGLSLESSQILGERGISCDEKGCYWSHDLRLRVLSPLSLSEEQIAAFMRAITCPVQIIFAPEFWQTRQAFKQQRLPYIPHAQIHELDGSHHQHMEGQVAEVAALVRQFLLD